MNVTVQVLAIFVCVMLSGFRFYYANGQPANNDINECDINNETCSDRGTCIDQLGSYNCTCDRGYTGSTCESRLPDSEASSGDDIFGSTWFAIGLGVGLQLLFIAVCAGVYFCKRRRAKKMTAAAASQDDEYYIY